MPEARPRPPHTCPPRPSHSPGRASETQPCATETPLHGPGTAAHRPRPSHPGDVGVGPGDCGLPAAPRPAPETSSAGVTCPPARGQHAADLGWEAELPTNCNHRPPLGTGPPPSGSMHPSQGGGRGGARGGGGDQTAGQPAAPGREAGRPQSRAENPLAPPVPPNALCPWQPGSCLLLVGAVRRLVRPQDLVRALSGQVLRCEGLVPGPLGDTG